MGNKPPCFECRERKAGCHAECKRYKKWSKDRRQKKAEAWNREIDATSYSVDKAVKNAKYGAKKGTRRKNV